MMTLQLRNPLFSEFYQTSFAINNTGCIIDIQRVHTPQQNNFHNVNATIALIKNLYRKNRPLTIRLYENPPANEVLHWLKSNQNLFLNLRIGVANQQPCSLAEFFENRAQNATRFINQITNGYPVIPTLPLYGRLPSREPFYISEWTNKDIIPLSRCIDNMYQRFEETQRHLAENHHRIDAQNMGDSYRIFWFFENRNEQNTSRDIAARFILRAAQERNTQPERDVYRLAIRNKNFEVVGGITLNMLPCPNAPLAEQGDIGYFIDPAHTGERYVSSAMDILLPFYFKTHDVLSFDIVSTPVGQPFDNLRNNLLSQRAAIHFGANQSSEPPPAFFAKGGYIPWCLTKENFYANRYEHVCRVFGRTPKISELVTTHAQGEKMQQIRKNHYLERENS